jgi:hypothetical protein
MEMATTPPSAQAFELLAQRHVCAPAFQLCSTRPLSSARPDRPPAVGHEVDARREDQPVVGQFGAAGQPHLLAGGVDGGHVTLHDLHAQGRQAVVTARDVGHLLVAADHQVADRAGHEAGVALDQRHVDVAAPQAQVACGRAAAEAAAHDDHAADRRAAGGRAGAAGQGQATHGGAGAQQSAAGRNEQRC